MSLRIRFAASAVALTSLIFFGAATSRAASIQFDFGATAGAYMGTQSPAHALGKLGAGDNQWNTLDRSAGQPDETEASGNQTLALKFTDGTAAPNVKVDFGAFFRVGGAGPGNPAGQIDWDEFESNINEYTYTSTQSIHNTALGNDLFYLTFDESGGGVIAFRVSGLDAGTYDVFGLAFVDETPASADARTYNVRMGVDIDELADDAPEVVGPVTGVSAWTQGGDYALSRLTITGPSQWITIFTTKPAAGAPTVMNGVQIVAVPVPEPASIAMLGIGSMTLIARRRRRHTA